MLIFRQCHSSFQAAEYAAIDGDCLFRQQTQLAAPYHELATDLSDGFAIVFAEVGDGFEGRRHRSINPMSSRSRWLPGYSRRLKIDCYRP